MEATAEFHLGYRRWLDGLRGLAILLVLAFHLGFVPGGWLGVDVFFVLSGFLITTLLAEEWQKTGSISLRNFYLRRVLRLMPAFLALLGALGLISFLLSSAEVASALRWEILVAGCYLSNLQYLHHVSLTALGTTWSLSLEEQFYLIWPLLLLLLFRLGLSRRQILLAVCGGIVAAVLLRMGLYSLHRKPGPDKMENILRLYVSLHTRADTLLVGCLIGLLATGKLLPRSPRFVTAMGLGSVVSAVVLTGMVLKSGLDHSHFYHGGFTLVALMVGCIIVRMLVAPSRIGSVLLESTPLVGAGRISYGLYLFHQPVIYLLQPRGLGWQHPGNVLIVLGLTIAISLLSYYCIERPCLRIKDRLSSRQHRARSVQPRLAAEPALRQSA